jgi:outer membrane receptor protein involved in Fe transport
MRQLRSLVIVALVVTLFPGAAVAQSIAEIRGVVEDESGGVVPGVTVTATNELTGLQRTTVSDSGGRYNFPRLLVGTYRVEAQLEGFRKFASADVRLSADDIRQVNIVMAVGEFSNAVTVSAVTTEVQTVGGTLSAVVDEQRIRELPLDGRNPMQLQLLLPGVVEGTGSNRSAQQAPISVHGLRGIANNYMLDGGDNNDPLMGVAAITPNPDALEEFAVQTSNFSAEYGRNMGAAINAVTKSGTNQFNGSGYEFVRNDAFDAKNFFATAKGKLRRNQFGATLGGPIVRDRAFFFAAYEGLRERTGVTRSNLIVPTQAERNGDFSQSTQKPRDPVTGQPFPNNQIPAARFDPASVNILQLFVPLPNQPSGAYIFNAPVNTDGTQLMGRVDYSPNAKHRLFGRAFHDSNKLNNTGGLPDIRNFIEYETWNAAVNHAWFITRRLVNSVQYTFAQTRFDVGPLPLPDNVSHQSLGIKINRGGHLPDGSEADPLLGFGVTGYFDEGQESHQPRDRLTYQLKQDLTYSRDQHVLKFGGEYRRTVGLRTQDAAIDGDFSFNGQYSGNAFADFLLGRVSAMTQGSLRHNDGRTHGVSLYAQDDWQIHPKLTVSAGLRWDPFFAFWDLDQPQPVFRPGEQSVLFPSAPVGLLYAGDPGIPKGGHAPRWNNYAPRLGIAWSPDQKTSARIGYGLFYDSSRDFQGPSSLTFTPPYSVTYTANGVQFSDPYAGLVNPFPYEPPQTQQERDNYTFFRPVRAESVAEDKGGGYSHQWNLNVQREVVGKIVLTGAYVGTKGIKMPLRREINPAIYRPGATLANRQQRRIYPEFQSITEMDPVGESLYHGLELSANKRFSNGYTIVANYSYGRARDNESSDSGGGQDPLNVGNNWGYADTNIKHRLVTSFLWQLPSPAQGLAKAVLGGWQFNGIVTLSSGLPFTVTSGRDTMLSFINSRANLVGDPNLPTDRPRQELIAMYFNPAAFAIPSEGTLGNSVRNFMTGPGFKKADLSLFRSFDLPGDARLQFRAEAFNAFNNVNLNTPVANISSATVGRITTAGPARVMQFGLRMTF